MNTPRPISPARRRPAGGGRARSRRRGVRLRVLVLLLALLASGAYGGAPAAPDTAVAAGSGGVAAEPDPPGTALGPPARSGRRPPALLRPAPLPDAGPAGTGRPAPVAPGPPHAPRGLRSVVLRC
ncbi:hypothetical protein GCM10010421_53080 [Streptomyces glaucus]|uniref:Secreted protein n=1 Tax=Streptomyces glaucus TaxID=284029 RepID=A0ABP5XHF7_9ACTN